MKLNKEAMVNELGLSDLMDIVIAVNSYDGMLQDYEVYEMEALDELTGQLSKLELIRQLDDEFDGYEDYFMVDSLGHYLSLSHYDYDQMLDSNAEEIIDVFIDNIDMYESDVSIDLSEYEMSDMDVSDIVDSLGVSDNMDNETYIELVDRIHDLGVTDVIFSADADQMGVDVDEYEEMKITVNGREFFILYKEQN